MVADIMVVTMAATEADMAVGTEVDMVMGTGVRSTSLHQSCTDIHLSPVVEFNPDTVMALAMATLDLGWE
jgi:hypothetical protein